MTRSQLINEIKRKKSYLCVGLDPERSKLPKHFINEEDALFHFCTKIIDATKDHCVAYKINTAFFEAEGSKGWDALERIVAYIPDNHFKIADAKRGDIGNTSSQYARAFFEHMDFDAVTVAPYMGEDSIKPFLSYKDKWTIVLGLTSNPGAKDFEFLQLHDHNHQSNLEYLYERVMKKVASWGTEENLMFVVGATRAEEFSRIRKIIPSHFLLIPGVGAQGGNLREISEQCLVNGSGLLVNISRSIIYASDDKDFAERAGDLAADFVKQMKAYIG